MSGRHRQRALIGVLVAGQGLGGAISVALAQQQSPAMADPRPAATETTARASSREVLGATLGLVALAAAGAGVYLTARVDRLSRDIEQAKALESPIPAEQIDEKVKAGERAERWQWVGYGTALAAGVGAAVLLLWPERRTDDGARASLLLTPTVAGASWRLVF